MLERFDAMNNPDEPDAPLSPVEVQVGAERGASASTSASPSPSFARRRHRGEPVSPAREVHQQQQYLRRTGKARRVKGGAEMTT